MELDFTKLGRIDADHIDTLDKSKVPDLKKFDSDEMVQNIYHYTSVSGIQGILSNKKLRFTHIEYMNDCNEVVVGEKLLREASKDFGEEHAEMLDKQLIRERETNQDTFVCCFSMEKDSLSMWNYYTKDINNQGYNIGIDYKLLVVSILKKNPELLGCKILVGEVDYCKRDTNYANEMNIHSIKCVTATLELLASLISGKPKEHKADDIEVVPSRVLRYHGEAGEFQYDYSLSIMYFMKRPCFSNEKEFRIVVDLTQESINKLKENGKYGFRQSNGVLLPYVDLEFDISCITGITMSPTIKSDLAERSIREYCKYCGIDEDNLSEKIAKSNIPVRY